MLALHRSALVVVLLFASAVADARGSRELTDPDPIQIPEGMTSQQVAASIKQAIVRRKWTVTGEKPGAISSTLNTRGHMVKVDVTYGKGEVLITYVDSAEMNYEEEDGKRYIHPKYMGWTNILRRDIEARLQQDALN